MLLYISLTFTLNGQLLNGSALSTAVVGGQGESLDAAAGTNTAGQHIVGVQVITTLRDEGRTEKHDGHIIIFKNLLFTNSLSSHMKDWTRFYIYLNIR